MASVTLDGNEYSADGSAPRDMLNGGHRTWFIPALADMLTEAQVAVTARQASEAARDLALIYASALSGTSSSSITVATGGLSITASAGKQWQVGQHLYVARTAAPTTWLAARVVSYNAGTGALSLDVVAVNGSGTYTDWQISIGGAQGPSGTINSLAQTTKTANYTAVSGDKGNLFRLDGTFTLAFTSAATLGNGWWAWLANVGSGVVTLDPSSTQQIDGLTTYPMYPGEARLVWCTGSALQTIVVRPFRHSFTASGTFTEPPGYSLLALRGWGAGGSGARSGSATNVTGGGGGGCFDHQLVPTPGAVRTVTIGAGGAAVTGAADGNDGGDTSYGSLFTWLGGRGGVTGTTQLGANAIAAGTAGEFPIAGAYRGAVGATNGVSIYGGGGSSTSALYGKSSVYGGGGGGAGSSNANGRTAGTSVYAGSGGDGGDATNGVDGAAPSGGGGGTRTGTSSGAGARGQLEIWGVC